MAAAKKQRPVQFDWAGPHGTAWGTVNTCATIITATSAVHVLWHAPPWVAAAAGVLGVVAVLARAAVRRIHTPFGTVIYQVSCWTGSATWAGWMFTQPDWTWRSWGVGIALLAAGAVAAGLIAAIASARELPDRVTPAGGELAARERVRLAEEWEARIARCTNNIRVHIEAVDGWESGHGYTIEGDLPEGGVGVDELRAGAARMANDANLPEGCQIQAYRKPGAPRRRFLMEVATSNPLAGDQQYPADIVPITVNRPVPVGKTPTAEMAELELRSRCMLVIGETGSGKTNFLHVTTASLVRCIDVIVFQIDLTGAGLARPWVRPWQTGQAARPAIGAVAASADEAMAMCRAIIRMGHARKGAYQDLMAAVDDDKLPIGHEIDDQHLLPEIVLMVDEIANITGTNSKWPDLRNLIVQIINELRASGFRVVLAGLRATDDVVIQAIQAMCHIKVGLKMTSKAEMAWLFEWSDGLDPADIADTGAGYLQGESGVKPYMFRTYRLKPSQIGAIAMAAGDPDSGWIPDLDPISRAAANGRHPDGTPMRGVPDGDLDWWERRWDSWQQGGKAAAPQPLVSEPQVPPIPAEYQAGGTTSLTEVLDNADAATRALEDRMAEVQGIDPTEMRRHRDEFEQIIAAQDWDADHDYADPATWSRPPEIQPPADMRDRIKARILELLADAGEGGAAPKAMLATLASEGMEIHRDTLHKYLREWREQGRVKDVRRGRWALIDGDQDDTTGGA